MVVIAGAVVCAAMGLYLLGRLPKRVKRYRRCLAEKELAAPPFGGRADINA